MQLTTQQQGVLDKVKEFLQSDASVFILRGYAGTGKTTMVKQIADYVAASRDLALMAPTGRAARVLHEKTGREANTIHKSIYGKAALETKMAGDIADSEFKLHFPIGETDGKIVAIVDEASMLCSKTMEAELFVFGTDNLMDDLLTFVRPSFGGKVIFVGDPAQLPPVGESESKALNPEFFIQKGLKVMTAELTEVLRQDGDSVILKNAMKIRDLLEKKQRNRLVFDERPGDVETLAGEDLMKKYFEVRAKSGESNSIIICYSNGSAAKYNKNIRQTIYNQEDAPLNENDVLMVVQNNYRLDKMNGEFTKILSVGSIVQQSAPVYVQEGGIKVRKAITLTFQYVVIPNCNGEPTDCYVLLDLLNNDQRTISIDEQRALYINFCLRHPELRPNTEAFANALQEDMFFNCLKAKYGYAVTGHKCQGGEWDEAFVDYSDRTGLDDDCLRWAYTATTRAQKTLYVSNLPHITPFSRFRIESVQQCKSINPECRILEACEKSPFHEPNAEDFLHAKCRCIMQNMEWTPYSIVKVESKPYQEMYYIQTPDSIERYDIRYKKGGIFLKAAPQTPTKHTVMISMMLDNERAMPLVFDYKPSSEIHQNLYNLVRSACDESSIQLTNVVEHKESYSVNYYFRTLDCFSYLMVYVDASGFVTYAKPMSLTANDNELQGIIDIIQHHFE